MSAPVPVAVPCERPPLDVFEKEQAVLNPCGHAKPGEKMPTVESMSPLLVK